MNTRLPIELSPEELTILSSFLESGVSRRLAANAIALVEEDLQCWIDESPRREAILGNSEAKFQLRCIEALLAPGAGKNSAQLRAIMWLLESRFPDQFGKKKTSKPAKQLAQDSPAATPTASTPVSESANIIDVPPQPFRNPHSEIRNAPAPGRNEPCPCTSGLKHKHCCGATNEKMRRTGLKTAASPEVLAAAA